jgi:hypothetical protein
MNEEYDLKSITVDLFDVDYDTYEQLRQEIAEIVQNRLNPDQFDIVSYE